jgi:hypothetical protein
MTINGQSVINKVNIRIYINVAIIGRYNKILYRLLNKINDSGLYEACDLIILVVNGDKNLLNFDYNDVLGKIRIIHAQPSINHCEFPGLHELWSDAKKYDFYVLYLHTKGVTHIDNKAIENWVSYLTYFNVEKWQDRINDLKEYDCTGVNFKGDYKNQLNQPELWFRSGPPPHYSGNFWWSKSSYIKLLPNPYLIIPDNDYYKWRYFCEMWVLQLSGKFQNAWKSGVRHYMFEPYPAFMYRGEKKYRIQRFLLKKLFRLFIRIMRKY